jgi:predicted RNA-binding protein
MCEANAYFIKDGEESLIMESVDFIKAEEGGLWHLESIFGEQKNLRARIKEMNLVDHRILFEA